MDTRARTAVPRRDLARPRASWIASGGTALDLARIVERTRHGFRPWTSRALYFRRALPPRHPERAVARAARDPPARLLPALDRHRAGAPPPDRARFLARLPASATRARSGRHPAGQAHRTLPFASRARLLAHALSSGSCPRP